MQIQTTTRQLISAPRTPRPVRSLTPIEREIAQLHRRAEALWFLADEADAAYDGVQSGRLKAAYDGVMKVILGLRALEIAIAQRAVDDAEAARKAAYSRGSRLPIGDAYAAIRQAEDAKKLACHRAATARGHQVVEVAL